jgi:DNA repair protein RecN (Recombination protein N)
MADAHFVVQKAVEKGRTFTRVKQLSEDERIGELARMLGGVKITEQTLKHAEELVRGK